MPTEIELIKSIKEKTLTVDGLTATEYQDVSFFLITSKVLKISKGDFAVSNLYKNEVDLVIEQKITHPLLQSQVVYHFLECKKHQRKLELDKVGKVFSAAIRYKPLSLTLISNSVLQPQAANYAEHFFGNSTKNNIVFRIITLEELIVDNAIDKALQGIKDEMASITKSIIILEWHLYGFRNFYKIEYASNQNERNKISIKSGEKLNLIINLKSAYTLKIKDCKILDVSGKSINQFKFSKNNLIVLGQSIKLQFELIATNFDSADSLEPACLIINSSQGMHMISCDFKLPVIEVDHSEIINIDIRQAYSDKLLKYFTNNNSESLALIKGEAGIGKTYLISKLLRRLSDEEGFRIYHYTIDENTNSNLFFEMLLPLTFPPEEEIIRRNNDFQNEVIKGYLYSLLDAEAVTSADEIVQSVLSGKVKEENIPIIISLLARIVVNSHLSVAILITNCQYLNSQLLNFLSLFVKYCDQLEWGHFKIFLEMRDTVDEQNEEFNELQAKWSTQLLRKPKVIEISPLDQSEIENLFNKSFLHTDTQFLSKQLIKKTGGNPLFIEHILRYFNSTNVIEKVINGATAYYQIVDQNKLVLELEHLPGSLENFLIKRIQYFDKQMSSEGKGLFSIFLGLSAFTGLTIQEEKVWHSINTDSETKENILQILISENIIKRSIGNNSISFAHDLLRVASQKAEGKSVIFRNYSRKLIALLKNDDLQDLLINGRINRFYCSYKEALFSLNRGFEITENNAEFSSQRPFLDCMQMIYEEAKSSEQKDIIAYLEVIMKIGWNEHHIGSLRSAIKYYEIALLYLNKMVTHEVVDNFLHKYQSEIYHLLLSSTLYTLDCARFLIYVTKAVETSSNLTLLGKILNRLIQFCLRSNLTIEAREFAQKALQIANKSEDPDVYAVLYADIGKLYLLSDKKSALVFFNRSAEMPMTERQKFHNTVDLLIGELFDSGRFCNQVGSNALIKKLELHSINILLVRMHLYEGIREVLLLNYSAALIYFLKAEKSAISCGYYHLELLAKNNCALCFLASKEHEKFITYLQQVYTSLQLFFNKIEVTRYKVKSILFDCQNRINTFYESKNTSHEEIQLQVCQTSSFFSIIVANIITASEKYPEFENMILDDHPASSSVDKYDLHTKIEDQIYFLGLE